MIRSRLWCLALVVVLVSITLGCASNKPVLSVHLADHENATGKVRIEMAAGEASLYADPTPVLDERDFSSVAFVQDQFGRPALQLCFAADARAKFLRIAEGSRSRRLAFLIRGKLLFAPVVTSDPLPECATVQGAVSGDDAEVLRRAIR